MVFSTFSVKRIPAWVAPCVAILLASAPPAAGQAPKLGGPPVAVFTLESPPAQGQATPADAGSNAAALVPTPAREGHIIVDSRAAFDWSSNPKPSFIPRPGFFAVLPTGPGYYSLLDMLTGNYRDAPPPFGYPRFGINATPFFDADFRYVDKPDADPDILERLHRIHVGDNWLFATGGEFRFRYYNEVNSRLSGRDNSYDLTRVRVFGDLWYQDRFRVFVEGIDAQDFGYNRKLTPNLIDRNYGDLLNAFVDVKVFRGPDDVPWYIRGGRQELVLGSQRLISALDWANTLRTFDGVRLLRHGEQFDFDLFWARPVIPNVNQFDHSDGSQNFAGAWMEYRPTKNQCLDLYYLYLDNDNLFNFVTKTPAPVGEFPVAPYTVSTLGYRYSGNTEFNKNILFDSENAIQFGHTGFAHAGLVAGASTTGLGYNFSEVAMNPTVWAYCDYASGSNNLKAGQLSTFNQLYPFGHYYFGGIDYIGRQNIMDWNFHAYLYPVKWVTLNAQLHVLTLSSATDALYNSAGQILRYDPTGRAGRSVGEELTFVANFHLTPRQDVFVAYSHLIEGRFLETTGPGSSAETLWLMYNFRW
jgi:hypothetical protein